MTNHGNCACARCDAANRAGILYSTGEGDWVAVNALVVQRVHRGWPLQPDDHLRDDTTGEPLDFEVENHIFVGLMEARDRDGYGGE